eukprot:gene12941-17349_t
MWRKLCCKPHISHTAYRSISQQARILETRLIKTNYDECLSNRSNKIGVISFNDPKKLNALTVEMGDEFMKAVAYFDLLGKEKLINSLIITGEGDAFSAGGDLEWLLERHETPPYRNSMYMIEFYNRFLSIRKMSVPTIAAINGTAIGAGLCLTLACDLRIVDSKAKLGFTFPKLGIHPGMGSSILLPHIVSQEIASYMLLSGSIFTGEEAFRRGLVLESINSNNDPEQLSSAFLRAMQIAKEINVNSPLS